MAGDESPNDASLVCQRYILPAVCCLGVSSMIVQVVLLREMLGAFCGNELVLGVILGNWMLLTGLGAWIGRWVPAAVDCGGAPRAAGRSPSPNISGLGGGLGRLRNPISVLIGSQLLVAIVPIAQVLLLRGLRDVVFIRGAMIGLGQTIVASLVLLSPYCLASGFMLTLACRMLGPPRRELMRPGTPPADAPGIRKVYLADSLGSVAGGVLISFILLRWVDHIGALYVPALLNLVCALAASLVCKRRILSGTAAAASLGVVGLMIAANLERVSTAIQYPSQTVLFSGSSPYGRIVVTESRSPSPNVPGLGGLSAGQINFIENGLPLTYTDNVEQIEETVHYAMAQRPGAQRVLLLGGGVGGTAKEVLKYGVRERPPSRDSWRLGDLEVVYVELDPLVIDVARRFIPDSLNDGRIKVINADARAFIRGEGEPYDVIIVDVPDPSTSLLNRLYTAEFYRDVKKRLSRDGVLSFSLGYYADSISPQLASMLSTAERTVRKSFRNVLLIPGGRVFFLASDGLLYDDIATRIEQAGVQTKLVNRHYLAAMLTPDRMEQLRRAIQEQAPVNEDFAPVLYYQHLLHWTSRFDSNPRLAGVVLLAALAIYLLRSAPVGLMIFASGLAATALEVVVLLGLQVLCGSLYRQLGMIVTVFMAGLVIGAFVAGHIGRGVQAPPNRGLEASTRSPRNTLAVLGFALAGFAALLPFALRALGGITPSGAWGILLQGAVALLTGGLAVLVGMQFPLAARAETGPGTLVASRLYVADFLGACLGAMLASAMAIPLLGVTATCLLTCGLCALAAGLLLLRRK